MLTQDYLVRLLIDFAAGIMRAMQRQTEQRDPRGAAELLEGAIGQAVDMDGDTLLALAPESIATVLQVSGTDPAVTEYMARSLMLASAYRAETGDSEGAQLRADQARAIAAAYGHDLNVVESDADALDVVAANASMQEFLSEDEHVSAGDLSDAVDADKEEF